MFTFSRLIALSSLLVPALAVAQTSMSVEQKIAAALKGEHRTEAELARDADRDPMAALQFIGLRDDMTVIEFLPAAQAYYTKILGPVLVEKGHLMTIDNSSTFSSWGDWTEEPEFAMTHPVVIENNYNSAEGRYMPGEINFGVEQADLFLHFREYHNFNEADNMRINAKVFDTLKSGGEYVVVDHTRRHMQPTSRPVGRRLDPVLVIKELLDTGFEFVDYSDMHFHPEEDLSQEVGTPGVRGATDRFTLKFRKP